MKKTMLLLLGMLISIPAFSRDFTYTHEGQTLTYTVIDEDAKTCETKRDWDLDDASKKFFGKVIIPSKAKDGETEYEVIGIGNNTFEMATKMTSVTIPNTVVTIDNGAFDGCESLADINIGNAVVSIGNRAFSGCAITAISIPSSVKTLGEYAFSGCEYLQIIYINGPFESLSYPITNCWSLSKIIFSSEEVAKSNEKYFKQFQPYNYKNQVKFYVGNNPYTRSAPEKVIAKMPYSISKDRGDLYWTKSAAGEKQLVNESGKVILTDKYDKIYFMSPAIIVVKNGKYGAISYSGKVLANPIYGSFEGSGTENRLWFANKTTSGYKYVIISQKGTVSATNSFTKSQYNSSTNWLKKQLGYIHNADWSFPAK